MAVVKDAWFLQDKSDSLHLFTCPVGETSFIDQGKVLAVQHKRPVSCLCHGSECVCTVMESGWTFYFTGTWSQALAE